MIYFENQFVIISWDAEIKSVILEAKGLYYQGDDCKLLMNKSIEAMVHHKAHKLLSDTTKLKVVDPDDQKWAIEDWTPRAMAAGLAWSAVVIPESVLGKMSMQSVTSKIKDAKLEIKYFPTTQKAKEWLRTL